MPRTPLDVHDSRRAKKAAKALEPPRTDRSLLIGRIIVGLIAVALLGGLARVAQLQHDPPDELASLIDSQRSRVTLLGRRGTLTDRNGRTIASTRIAYRLFADPALIPNDQLDLFAPNVAVLLDYDPTVIDRRLSERPFSRFVVLDPRLSDDRLALYETYQRYVSEHPKERIKGLAVQPYLVRDYPLGHVGGQVVGAVGRDGKGLEGLEQVLDRALAADGGEIHYWRDVLNRPIWAQDSDYLPPIDGPGIRLSMDITIQSIAEEELRRTCEEYEADSAQLVVLDPHTGEILAMANYPHFDPGTLGSSSPEDRRNRCVTDAFEPGSTFKPFVWAAALDGKFTNLDERLDCTTTGRMQFFGRRWLNDAHPIGEVSLEEVLVYSSNIGMAQLGERMGVDNLYDAVTRFGFGSKPGSELPGEMSGIVNPRKQWNSIYSVTSVPMGQEIAVTALQLARGFAVFANGGFLVTPTAEARSDDYWTYEATLQPRVLSGKTVLATRRAMRHVVTQGTGRRVKNMEYDIFGKTGTAQVPDPVNGGYLDRQYTAVFVGGAPFDQPRLVIACAVHRPNPDKGYYGGIVAAPTAGRVLERALEYLGTEPDRAEGEDLQTVASH